MALPRALSHLKDKHKLSDPATAAAKKRKLEASGTATSGVDQKQKETKGNAAAASLALRQARKQNTDRQSIFEKGLLRWISGDVRPLNIVEDKGFVALIRWLDPKLVVPSADTITRSADEEFDRVQALVLPC